jgi:preprotein translocase subunit SecD
MNYKIATWKNVAIFLVCLILVVISLPNFLSLNSRYLPSQKVNYGLDLRGGSQLLLKVNFPSYLQEQLELTGSIIRKSLRKERVGYTGFSVNNKSIVFHSVNLQDIPTIKSIIKKTEDGLDVEAIGNKVLLSFGESKIKALQRLVLEQTQEIVRYRIDETGTKEPSIQRQGDFGILLQVPGLNDPSQLKRILGKTAKLSFHLVDEDNSIEDAVKGSIPNNTILVRGDENSWYLLKKDSFIGGDMLVNAKFINNEHGQPAVSFSFNNMGARLFADITRHNKNKRLAIVLDEKVLSAPMINEPIIGGSGVISGSFTVASANELAMLLRAGALPAPVEIAEEKIVGPSLGEDSIVLGRKSALIGTLAVMVFMIAIYGVLGIFASIALIFNVIFILAIMTIMQATLTLPGIAGIVLTVGMAVDANVLIFERIREESSGGPIGEYVIKRGFEQAFATILDSNLTTLIAAFFLYIFGSGVIQGFAVTLTIGILSSMFTAITLTKIFITMWMHKRKSML